MQMEINVLYHIKWKGYPGGSKWMQERLKHLSRILVGAFHASHPGAAIDARLWRPARGIWLLWIPFGVMKELITPLLYMRDTEVPLGSMSHSVSRNGFPGIFSDCKRVFWVLTFIFSCIFSSYATGFFGFYFICFEILLYIFSALPLRGLGFLKELDYVEVRNIRGGISPEEGQVSHIAGLTTCIGGRLRSNNCNIFYIAVIALSLC